MSSVVCEYYSEFGEVQDMTFMDVGDAMCDNRTNEWGGWMALRGIFNCIEEW